MNNLRNFKAQTTFYAKSELLTLFHLAGIKTIELLAWEKMSVLLYII